MAQMQKHCPLGACGDVGRRREGTRTEYGRGDPMSRGPFVPHSGVCISSTLSGRAEPIKDFTQGSDTIRLNF